MRDTNRLSIFIINGMVQIWALYEDYAILIGQCPDMGFVIKKE